MVVHSERCFERTRCALLHPLLRVSLLEKTKQQQQQKTANTSLGWFAGLRWFPSLAKLVFSWFSLGSQLIS